jgi:hypothetical protein
VYIYHARRDDPSFRIDRPLRSLAYPPYLDNSVAADSNICPSSTGSTAIDDSTALHQNIKRHADNPSADQVGVRL